MATDYDTLIAKAEAALAAKLDGGAIDEYFIRGRNIRYMTVEAITDLITWLKRQKQLASTPGAPLAYGIPMRPRG